MQVQSLQELSLREELIDHGLCVALVIWPCELSFLLQVDLFYLPSIVRHHLCVSLADHTEQLQEELVLVGGLLREHRQVVLQLGLPLLGILHHFLHRLVLRVRLWHSRHSRPGWHSRLLRRGLLLGLLLLFWISWLMGQQEVELEHAVHDLIIVLLLGSLHRLVATLQVVHLCLLLLVGHLL